MNRAAAARTHPVASGLLALLVHALFLMLLVFGIHWRTTEPPGMTADLWTDLPPQPTPAAAPARRPPPPPPEPVPQKKIEPKPPAPAPTSKSDIALKDKKTKNEKRPAPKPEPIKPDNTRQEQVKQEQARQAEIARQQLALAELARLAQARQNAAHQSVINDYSDRIRAKMRNHLNKELCGGGNPELIFDIRLLATGQIIGNPMLRKGSGSSACDKAVFDAIMLSEPLPVPPQPDIFNEFRDLHLSFKPNS